MAVLSCLTVGFKPLEQTPKQTSVNTDIALNDLIHINYAISLTFCTSTTQKSFYEDHVHYSYSKDAFEKASESFMRVTLKVVNWKYFLYRRDHCER